MKKNVMFFLAVTIIAVIFAGCSSAASNTNSYSGSSSTTNNSSTISEKPSNSGDRDSSTSSTSSSRGKEKVTCSTCNGTGSVKYYYGSSALEAALDGHNDYEYGPCPSCDGKGYVYIKVTEKASGKSSASSVVCPSCGKRVSSLITKKDAAGVNRKWCSSCWREYENIMGG